MKRRFLEASVEKPVVAWARAHGIICLKLTIVGFAGLPDRLFLARGGRLCFIEFKRPGEPLEPLQLWWFAKLGEYGFNVEAHDEESDAIRYLTRVLGS